MSCCQLESQGQNQTISLYKVESGQTLNYQRYFIKKMVVITTLLLMLAGYLVMSWVLFFFPSLLHKPHKYPRTSIFLEALYGGKILRVAHRGGSRIGVQNTVQTFEKAKQYSDMMEMDVCETKDGILVVHHDHDLERTCGKKAFIRDLNFEELPSFKEKIELNFASEGMTIASKGEKISILDQVFTKFPEMPMNIQLKTPSVSAIQKLNALIQKHNRQPITVVGIRNSQQETLKQVNRKLMTFMKDGDFFFYFIAMIFGLLPYIYVDDYTMQVPLWTKESQQWKLRQWGNKWQYRLFFKVLKVCNCLMGLLAYHLRKRGILTFFWVCNCSSDFDRAIKYGASAIITDDPPLLDEYLASKKGQKGESELNFRQKKDE